MVVSTPPKVADPAEPPLLTGTFRPKELLRRIKSRNGEFDWEFTPVKVPDGISLRNFGIQVVCIIPSLHLPCYILIPPRLFDIAYICHSLGHCRILP